MRWHRCLKMTIQFHLTKNVLGFLCAPACCPEMKICSNLQFAFALFQRIRTEKPQVKSKRHDLRIRKIEKTMYTDWFLPSYMKVSYLKC